MLLLNNNKFFPVLEKSRPESVIKVTGKVVKRAAGTENLELKTLNILKVMAVFILDNPQALQNLGLSNTRKGINQINMLNIMVKN